MAIHWIVFGLVWGGLIVAAIIVVGASSASARERMNSETHPFDMRRSHLVHLESSAQLFVIQVLLAGILAAQVAALFVG